MVTFNRKNLLRECLKTLERQSRKPDQILVVNNHSTDGTEVMLQAEFQHLPCLHLAENRGGAGGFFEGMKWACESGYDWMWMMDDDIEAYPQALERMLGYQELSHFIHMRREQAEGAGALSIEGIWDLSSCTVMQYGHDLSFDSGNREWVSALYGNFEGVLIHRSVVDKIGYPDERFFIGGDDLIYGFLASFHTNVLYLREVGFRRALEIPKRIGRMNYYLMIRNRFLLKEHLEARGAPVDRLAFWFQLLRLVVWVLRQAPRGFQSGWTTNAAAAIEGLRDGVRGRFGRPPWIPG